jgi:hypothetical protein
MALLRIVNCSMLSDLSGTGPLGDSLAGDVRRLTGALCEVRVLLVQRHPGATL